LLRDGNIFEIKRLMAIFPNLLMATSARPPG